MFPAYGASNVYVVRTLTTDSHASDLTHAASVLAHRTGNVQPLAHLNSWHASVVVYHETNNFAYIICSFANII